MNLSFIKRYLSPRVLPIWMILFMDVAVTILSVSVAYVLRFSLPILVENSSEIIKNIGIIVLINLVFFRVFKTYSNVLRFSSFIDILRIIISLSASYGSLIALEYLLRTTTGASNIQTSVLLIAFVVNATLMVTSRIVVKTFFEMVGSYSSKSTRVFI